MLIRRLVELITPLDCLGCGRDGVVFCTTCLKSFGLGEANTCFGCRLPSPAGATCGRCSLDTALVATAVGAKYDRAVKELVLRLKFHRLWAAEEAAADLVLGAIPAAWNVGLVTAVPVSAARYRERGYNQAEMIARRVARGLSLPYSSLLGRGTSTHQLGVDRRTRIEQVQGVFEARGPVQGRILVIDDVLTTGATLSACANALKAAGAQGVWGAVVAGP
jgi:ComF family protein